MRLTGILQIQRQADRTTQKYEVSCWYAECLFSGLYLQTLELREPLNTLFAQTVLTQDSISCNCMMLANVLQVSIADVGQKNLLASRWPGLKLGNERRKWDYQKQRLHEEGSNPRIAKHSPVCFIFFFPFNPITL